MTRSAFIRTSRTGTRPSERSAATLAKPSVRAYVVVACADRLRVEGEAEHAEQVDVIGPDRLAGGVLDVRRTDCSVLRADRDADPTGAVAASSRLPTAWMYAPAYGSTRSKVRRSSLLPFWMPALRRFSMIVCSNDASPSRDPRRACCSLAGCHTGAASEGERAVRRQALDGERACDPDLPLCPRMACRTSSSYSAWRLIAASISCAAHPFHDVRVVGDRLERDVLHPLVDEPVRMSLVDLGRRQRLPVSSLSFFRPSAESASR